MASTNQRDKNSNSLNARQSQDIKKAIASIESQLEKLKIAPEPSDGKARNARARATIDKILIAGHETFEECGHAALSLREVAKRAGVAVGNLTYYFVSKDALLQAVLNRALANYIEAHLTQFDPENDDALDILLRVVGFYIRNGRQTHRFFYQLWGYVGSSDEARDHVRRLYTSIGRFVYYLVRAANPDLSDREIRLATLQIFSLEEGYKLFVGMGPDDDVALQNAEEDVKGLICFIVGRPVEQSDVSEAHQN